MFCRQRQRRKRASEVSVVHGVNAAPIARTVTFERGGWVFQAPVVEPNMVDEPLEAEPTLASAG